ncbi:hypothetical protein MY4038_002173 [Beauveria bassiana]
MVHTIEREVATTVCDFVTSLGFARDRLTLGDMLAIDMATCDRGYRL